MDSIETAKQAHKHSGAVAVLLPVVRGLVTIFLAGIGIMLGATVCALAFPEPPGVGAIGGGTAGALIFGTIGCLVSGLWRDLGPGEMNMTPSFIPHSVYKAVGKHGDFELLLTIHGMDPVRVTNRLWNKPSAFVEIECGENPLKQSCVSTNGVFQEQFKLYVKAADEAIVVYMKDQQFFGSDIIGYVSLDIQKHIVDRNFPKHIKDAPPDSNPGAFQILGGSGYTLKNDGDKAFLYLSFEALDIKVSGENEEQATQTFQQQVAGDWKSYGSVGFLSSMQFNRDVMLDFNDQATATQPLAAGQTQTSAV